MMNPILNQLGVQEDLLSPAEKECLDQNGYVNLGQLLSEEQLTAINDRLHEILHQEGANAGAELMDSKHIRHPKEAGADRLADLVNKGEVFDVFYTHPKVLAAMARVIGSEFKLSALNYRAAKPGMGSQKLHVDWHEAVTPGDFKVCNSIWLLDDFSKANGATRIVPGTHLTGELPQDMMEDPWASHPEEILIEAPAGSVFIFNSHVWHGGTNNSTQKYRRAVHSYFCRKGQPQQIDQKRYILEETKTRLSQAAIEILGV